MAITKSQGVTRSLYIDYIKNVIQLIRVKHWVKNLAVYIPALFAAQVEVLISTDLLMLFFAFCLTASVIYIINDIVDIEKDRLHPEKRFRPLASGFISITTGIGILAFLLIPLVFLLVNLEQAFFYVIGYFILNILYSFKLKEISIVDVSCISLGFVLRILAGGVATGIYVTNWLMVIIFLAAISLAFAKRRDDLYIIKDSGKEKLRKSLSGYTIDFLNMAISISLAVTLVAYIIYSVSPEVMERIGSDKVYITSLFVFLGVMRYLQITVVENKSGSPVGILWRDRFIQVNIVMWGLSFYLLLYGGNL